ncbi:MULTISPECIES: GNAT family N-acetyltransferase [Streptomyces]|uniref:Acetyltransferase n=1 Tax=Streptomyces albus (strain ATCC 21838 / DSM 41398 / FERM P-419 / JCM 4703 / NBRC 107858) TaxID=1081613 RepID=A0A0B5EUL1_STRA4|nr:GNAT family N-acetyltransferase [Streptomyces sp. SCSIO ZS0520]AJE82920.1 acetyltransferase [Streptomyces albus]AOU77231.1 acetyltransferase [Streptomyces albus]AYN33008.1 N-acetyltransferase [Streptomyces albus]
MEPVALATERLLLRTVGPDDTQAVYEACQDPDIQHWTTIPSPYLHEHAAGFTGQMVPDGWHDASMFTFGVFPRGRGAAHGPLAAMLGLTRRGPGTGEIGFWAAREHRGKGYVVEATLAVCRWACTEARIDRIEWRAEVGNHGSRATALRAGFTMEGVQRAGMEHRGARRDCWVGSLLPADLDLPANSPYVPGPAA